MLSGTTKYAGHHRLAGHRRYGRVIGLVSHLLAPNRVRVQVGAGAGASSDPGAVGKPTVPLHQQDEKSASLGKTHLRQM